MAPPVELVVVAVLSIPIVYFLYQYIAPSPPVVDNQKAEETSDREEEKQPTIMQPERDDIAPPKDDPFALEQLKPFNGSDPTKPIYVSIKGTVFDVTRKADVYGVGKSYNVFAGTDGSKGLGMSSLKTEDAVPDYSGLDEADMKTLNDWHSFFSKRYNIVGRVVDLPDAVAGF